MGSIKPPGEGLTFYHDALDFGVPSSAPPSVTRDVFLSGRIYKDRPACGRRCVGDATIVDLKQDHAWLMRALGLSETRGHIRHPFHEVKDAAAIDLQLSMAWLSCVCVLLLLYKKMYK